MSKIQAIRNYFDQCPLLDENARLDINYMSYEPLNYSIYTDPGQTVIKQYVDGGSLNQFLFTFATISYQSSELQQQLDNTDFNEELVNWIEENNEKGILPEINGAEEIQLVSPGFLIQTEGDKAQFQIQFRLIYRR